MNGRKNEKRQEGMKERGWQEATNTGTGKETEGWVGGHTEVWQGARAGNVPQMCPPPH